MILHSLHSHCVFDSSPYDLDLCFQGYEGSLLKVTNKNGKNTSVSIYVLHDPNVALAVFMIKGGISCGMFAGV